jgi:hypothetical protein
MAFEDVPVQSTRNYSMLVYHQNGVSFEIGTGISQYGQAEGDQAAEDLAAYLNAWPQRDLNQVTTASKTVTHQYVTQEPALPEEP